MIHVSWYIEVPSAYGSQTSYGRIEVAAGTRTGKKGEQECFLRIQTPDGTTEFAVDDQKIKTIQAMLSGLLKEP